MRNLKRVLSLALALVMVIGMMVMGAGAASADFGDAAEIDYTEAVDVISGLGIMIGDDQGNFNAKDTLTREQAAKIICYAMIGAENAEKLGKNTQIFNDVAAGRWSAGYIAYCANLGLLVGYGNGNFGPTDTLTGVQFGKLLLVAAGYNAETQGYTGADWATNIATDMINNGLDIKGVVMSDALTREQAAQMLLQAMDMKTVTYTTGNVVGMIGPYETGKTFAETYFPNLTKIDGVITANEYADLDNDKALKAGKTEIDGVVYNYSSDLTMIGMSYVGWANGKDVLYLADSGDNTVFETGAATSFEKNGKYNSTTFKKVTGLDDEDAEFFVNFDNAYDDKYISDYRIAYGDPNALKVIPKNNAFGDEDMTLIEAIFNDKDDTLGGQVVYVGTQNKTDVSDTLSYKQFMSKYIEEYEVLATGVSETENGEWLKVIDNDNDGVAEYVFKTQFAMAEVTNISKKGVITIEGIETDEDKDGYNADEIVALDELAVNDVVVYTIIEKVAYVKLADSFTATVKKYSFKDETLTTTDDETYQQSGIFDYTGYIWNDIADLEDETYIFYVDFFGFVRVAAEPDGTADNYMLITEFYNKGSNNDNLISTKTTIAETVDTEGNIAEYEIAKVKKVNDIDASLVDDAKVNNVASVIGTFGKDVNGNKTEVSNSWTNVAAYELSEDDLLSLDTAYEAVYNRKDELKALTAYTVLENEVTKGQKHFTIDGDVDYINVTQNTIVYYVLGTAANKIESVDVVVGYSNIVPVKNVNAVYAVVDLTSKDTVTGNDYFEAKILVIEAEDYLETYKNALTFVYSNPEKETKKVFAMESIDKAGALDTLYVESEYTNGQYVTGAYDALTFYPTYENKKGYDVLGNEITENFADWNIFAGEFKRYQAAAKMDYIDVIVNGTDLEAVDMLDDAVVYTLTAGKNGTYSIDTIELDNVDNKGDKIIYVTNKDNEVIYIIDVTASFTTNNAANKAAATVLGNLWTAIVDDAAVKPAAPTAYETAVAAALKAATKAELESAKAGLEALTGLTTEQAAYVKTLKADLQAKLDKIAADTKTLEDNRAWNLNEVKKAYDGYDAKNYYTAEYAEITALYNAAKATIENATTVEAMYAANLKFVADAKAVKTGAQVDAAKAEAAKKAAAETEVANAVKAVQDWAKKATGWSTGWTAEGVENALNTSVVKDFAVSAAVSTFTADYGSVSFTFTVTSTDVTTVSTTATATGTIAH